MLKKLTTQDLKTYDDQVMDIARGLGDGVDVVVISGGGTVASWLAQKRPELKCTSLTPLWISLTTRWTRQQILPRNSWFATRFRNCWENSQWDDALL
jgi:hypothetical protein